jgi:endonuclease-3
MQTPFNKTIYINGIEKGLLRMTKEDKERASEILSILKANFDVPDLSGIAADPFKVLVRTIISQSTAEANTRQAYHNLSTKLLITPEGLAKANLHEIEDALRVAGLYRNKSKVLKRVAELIQERFNGSLDFIYTSQLSSAREKLMGLPGVGPKTADIVLLFSGKRPTLPVDTHVNRVSKRLGLVLEKADYEHVRLRLQELYPPKEYFNVHMLLIALGRACCKALKPNHALCPVKELCPSSGF